MSALIDVRSVQKRFGRKLVLRNIGMTVEEGEVAALLGANGAGKSTLMRIVSGLTKADRGEVHLGGVPMRRNQHELRRYIGLVSHAPLLYDQLSAVENLQFFSRMYDIHQPQERIEGLLQSVDLWHRRRDPVRTYSRGMVQRLAIARAILHDPPVLLLDEPDTGLDQTSSEMLHNLIRRLGGANRAILLSTHNLERARDWADSVRILSGGEIVYEGPTAQLADGELRRIYADVSAA